MTEFPRGKDDRESVLSPFLVDQINPQDKRLFGRFLWLTGGRLVVATLLLGGTLAITIHQDPEIQGFTSRFLLALIVATYLVSLASALALRRLRGTRLYAATQLLWDLALTTCLIYLTGGFSSGFPFLYGLQILMAAIVIGPNASRATGVLSLTIYAVTGVALSQDWLPHPPDQPAARYLTIDTEIVVIAVLHVVGLAAVTLLASGLASRLGRTGGELQRATSDAARLAHLNENIVRSLSSGLMTVDEHAIIRTINPAGALILNTTTETSVGNAVYHYIPTLQQEALGADNRLLRAEGTARRIDGTLIPIGYSRTPLRDAAGQEHGELILFQDLSELKKLRDAARRAESLAALGRLSAGLAHEIRNPLGSISGSVELIRASDALSTEEQQLLDIVLKEVERLNGLVTTMLELGAPRKPRFEPTDLCRLTQDVTEMARKGNVQSSSVTIAAQISADPVIAYVDADQVRQVLWNLIKNAQQASPPNAMITVRVWSDDNHKAYIEVSDEGPGVSSEDQERLYDMFYTGRKHGVGLGLALVRQIVDAHQGNIEVHSKAGTGARFLVSFPQTLNAH